MMLLPLLSMQVLLSSSIVRLLVLMFVKVLMIILVLVKVKFLLLLVLKVSEVILTELVLMVN